MVLQTQARSRLHSHRHHWHQDLIAVKFKNREDGIPLKLKGNVGQALIFEDHIKFGGEVAFLLGLKDNLKLNRTAGLESAMILV